MGIVAESNDPYVESTAIAAVRNRSPAAKAGLQSGDKIVGMNGVEIHSHREIKQLLGAKDAGDSISVRYSRDGKEVDTQITLTRRNPST